MRELHKHLISIYYELRAEKGKARREYFSQIAGVGASAHELVDNLDYNSRQLYNTNRGGKGHGIAAEEANTIIDRIKGREAEIVGRGNAKNGADRIVDGQKIQTKYQMVAKSVNSSFDNKGDGLYEYYDEDGNPMQLEVPKDQYEKAVEHMERKIHEGKVPDATDPEQAADSYLGGNVAYQESINITKWCTEESFLFDTQGLEFGVISGCKAVALAATQGVKNKDGIKTIAKNSLKAGAKSATRAAATSVVANQVMRSSVGQIVNKDAVTACVATAVLTAGDVYKSFVGEQSFKQTGKNFLKNGSGVVGAIVGASLLGDVVPLVGAIAGGAIGAITASKMANVAMTEWLDVKDDVDEMLEILNRILHRLQEQYWFSEDEEQILTDVLRQSDLRLITEAFIKTKNKEHFCCDLVEPLMLSITEDREAKMLISPKEFYEDFKNVELG